MKLIRSELQFSDSFVCSKHQTVTELTDRTVDVLYEAETTHYTNARAQKCSKRHWSWALSDSILLYESLLMFLIAQEFQCLTVQYFGLLLIMVFGDPDTIKSTFTAELYLIIAPLSSKEILMHTNLKPHRNLL